MEEKGSIERSYRSFAFRISILKFYEEEARQNRILESQIIDLTVSATNG